MKKPIIAGVVSVLVLVGGGIYFLQSTNNNVEEVATTALSQPVTPQSTEVSQTDLVSGIAAKQVTFEATNPEYPTPEKESYVINDDGTTTPELHLADAQLWDLIKTLAPSEETFDSLKKFTIYFDEDDTSDASVAQIDDNGKTWEITINYKAVDDFQLLVPVVVHEFSHVLSLQDDQITSESEDAAIRETCDSYLIEEGCVMSDTMLNAFYTNYWKDSDAYQPGVERSLDEAAEFYATHTDQYVTDYATTNPIEDFAESIMFFSMKEPVDAGTVKREKTDFFNNYSNIVNYRTKVRSAVANWAQ